MGQSSYIYILWLVVLAAGLWLIIGYGSALLNAPEDLAGEWVLTPQKPAAGTESSRLAIEQSGRFFKLTLPAGKPLAMKMIEEKLDSEHFGEHKRIVLSGDGAKATFEGRARGDLWQLTLEGPLEGGYVARLTERTYPKPAPARGLKAGQRPAAAVTKPDAR